MIFPSIIQADSAVKLEDKDIHINRIAGKTRIHTAIEASKLVYKGEVDTVILAGYSGEADALTGTLIATHNNAPLLLTHKNKVSDDLIPELERLKAKKIILLGGNVAISKDVENQLKSKYEVQRLAGNNRAETAVKVASNVVGENTEHIFLALGYNDQLADALAIGPVSAMEKSPILLTQSKKLPKETEEAIRNLNVKKVTIIGGYTAIDREIENKLKALDLAVDRISGNNREDTALKIASEYFPEAKNTIVASGWNYADALIGGYLGAYYKIPILLTTNKSLSPITNQYIKSNSQHSYLLGGDTVVTKEVYDNIKLANQMTEDTKYIGNNNTKVFHGLICRVHPNEKNRVFFDSKEEAIASGYRACKVCKP